MEDCQSLFRPLVEEHGLFVRFCSKSIEDWHEAYDLLEYQSVGLRYDTLKYEIE